MTKTTRIAAAALLWSASFLAACNEAIRSGADDPGVVEEHAAERPSDDPCERRLRRAPHIQIDRPDFALNESWHLEPSAGRYLEAIWLGGNGDSEVSKTPLSLQDGFIVVPPATWHLDWPSGSTSTGPKEVTFQHGFAISKELVSAAAWRQCEADCYCEVRASDHLSDDQPMLGVSWEDIRTFNFWIENSLPQDRLFRHPSAAEWMVLQQLRPDFVDSANPEWVGDCAASPKDRVLQDGTAMDWANGPCSSHMLLMTRPEYTEGRFPYSVDRASRATPAEQAGFRIARDFDIAEMEGR